MAKKKLSEMIDEEVVPADAGIVVKEMAPVATKPNGPTGTRRCIVCGNQAPAAGRCPVDGNGPEVKHA